MKLALLAGFLMALGIAGILITSILRIREHYIEEEIDYGIFLDAGSTSTKAYIYEWEHKITTHLPTISLSLSDDNVPRTLKVRPGIATIEPNVTQVSSYLEPIIEWAQSVIPDHKRSTTRIYFQGTGGIRQLPETSQGALLTSVRFKLQDSGFLFDNTYASILTGAEEAAFGFLAVNGLYSEFTFADTSSDGKVYGSLDMGGTSAEIAFVSQNRPPANYTFTIDINGTTFNIYAQSTDGLGINEARYTLNESLFLNSTGGLVRDPCVPSGYNENVTTFLNGQWRSFLLMGTSDPEACSAQVYAIVRELTNNLPTPPIGDTVFVVADHYIDVKKFYKLKDNANILELEAKVSSFCSLNYVEAMAHHKKDANEVQNYCFMGNYLVSLLRDYYGFDPTLRHILWKESVHKTPVSWTLGSMMNIVDDIPADTSSQVKTRFLRFFRTAGGTVTLFISCLLFVLGLVLFILQRRRPSEYVPIR